MNSNDTDTNPRIQNQEFEEFEVISEGSEKFVREKRTNVKSDLIEITEDKLENILLKHVQLLEVRKSWITPLSLFVAIMLTNLSATFGDKLGIKRSCLGSHVSSRRSLLRYLDFSINNIHDNKMEEKFTL